MVGVYAAAHHHLEELQGADKKSFKIGQKRSHFGDLASYAGKGFDMLKLSSAMMLSDFRSMDETPRLLGTSPETDRLLYGAPLAIGRSSLLQSAVWIFKMT